MKKTLLFTLSLCSVMAMGQMTNFDSVGKQPATSLYESLTGNSRTAYELMINSAKKRVNYVAQATTDVPADKARITLEAHKVYGSFAQLGFQMLLDANHDTYDNLFYDWSSAYFGTYEDFEYAIPEGADANEMSSNVVIDDAVSIEIPAGIYDFMVLGPIPGDGIIFNKGEFSKGDDFEFKGGNSYRFFIEYGEDEYGGYYPFTYLYTDVDVALSDLKIPDNSMDLTNSESITVEILNRGTTAVSNINVSYQIDDAAVVTEVYSGTIEPQETVSYTFNAKADMSQEKQYVVKAWISYEGDMISSNDSLTGKCKHIGVSQLPFTYDFSSVGAENIEADWIIQDLNEDENTWMYNEWTSDANGNSGAVSCSGCWWGDKIGNDNFISPPIFLPAGDNHIIFYTKCINGETTELLDLRYGTSTDVESMEILGDYTINQTTWVKRIVNFNVAQEGVYYFAFHAKSYDGMNVFVDDITIDNGFFTVKPELVVEKVVLPYSTCDLSDQSVVGAVINNKGTGATSTFKLTYSVNGENYITETFTDALQPTESKTYYFETKADFSELGEYEVLVEAASADVVEHANYSVVNNYEAYTNLPVVTNFPQSINYIEYWSEMNNNTWRYDEIGGTFGTEKNGIENGLISRCFYLKNPVRIKIQYAKGGWVNGGMYIAYGKGGADVSTYTKIYEDTNIQNSMDVEFVVDIADPDNYCFVLVNTAEDGGNLYLGELVISELLPYDLRIQDVETNFSYNTPLSQTLGENLYKAVVVNRGSEAMTGVKATLYNNGEALATSSEGVNISAGDVAYVTVAATLPQQKVGDVINLSMSVAGDKEDEYAPDNKFVMNKVVVTDTVFATEDEADVEYGIGEWGYTLNVGNMYTLSASDVLSSITVGFSTLEEYDIDNAYNLIGVAIYEVNDNMTLGNKLQEIEMKRGMGGISHIEIDPMLLNPGNYFFEVQQRTTTNMGLAYTESAQSVCYQNIDGTLSKKYGLALMVRANFAHGITVPEKDAAVVKFTHPAKTSALFSSSESVTAIVKNKGSKAAAFSVECKVNGTHHNTRNVELIPYQQSEVTFTDIDLSQAGTYNIEVSVLLEGDEVAENNTLVLVLESEEESNPYVMNFEACNDFDAAPDTFNPRWWTVDRNNQPTDSWWRYDYPYYAEPVGFMAFNPEATTPAIDPDDLPGFTPHSGKRFGAAFCVGYDAEAMISDVWLVSPKLQLSTNSSLELYVKTRILETMDQGEEKYRLLISDTDDNFDSFVVLGENERFAPTEWTKVEVDLSAYNNKEVYVAIQYIGEKFENVVMMVDDIAVKGDGIDAVKSVRTLDNVSIRYSAEDKILSVDAPCNIDRIELYDVQGRLVGMANNVANNKYRMKVSNATAGVYVTKVFTAEGCGTQKIVVR